jgi:integrase
VTRSRADSDVEGVQRPRELAVAARFDATGQYARAAADQLGHTHPSMTRDRYNGRHAQTNAADVLAAFFDDL